ncbi:MAG: HNH endonuclease signature motif containing protein [Dermatophilaceae bacterium]
MEIGSPHVAAALGGERSGVGAGVRGGTGTDGSAEGVSTAGRVREAVDTAYEALRGLRALLPGMASDELGPLMTDVDALVGQAAAARVAITVAAAARGDIAASQHASVASWVMAHAPILAAAGGVGAVARIVREAGRPECLPVVDAVASGRVDAGVGVSVVKQFDRLRPLLRDDAAATVIEGMLEVGASHGRPAVRELRAKIVATYGGDAVFEHQEALAAAAISLSQPMGDELGGFSYQLTVDGVGKAVLEAAIGPASAPVPGPGGEPDPRSTAARRGMALIEVCRRATAAGVGLVGGVKSTLLLTMTAADIAARAGAGTVLGSLAGGLLVGAETVRQASCDGEVVPVAVSTKGDVVGVGRGQRLFPPTMIKAMWLRDRGCTFAGCGAPAHWCDAHHLVHWADGGATDVSNGALLCGRHHTIVHRDRLIGRIVAEGAGPLGVVWDVDVGSYDRHLQRARSGLPADDRGPDSAPLSHSPPAA